MNVEGNFELQFMRKFGNKLIHIILILVIFILDRLLQSLKEVKRQLILFVNPIHDDDTLLQLCICMIVILENGG